MKYYHILNIASVVEHIFKFTISLFVNVFDKAYTVYDAMGCKLKFWN